MSDQSKNLPNEDRDAGESLDFTAEDLLNELAEYFKVETRQPGDVDLEQIAERFGLKPDSARKVVYKIVNEGKLKRVMVIGPHGKRIAVYRKVPSA